MFGGFLLVQSHQFDDGVPNIAHYYLLQHAQNGWLSLFLFITGFIGLYAALTPKHLPRLKMYALIFQTTLWAYIEALMWYKDYLQGVFPPHMAEFLVGWFLWRCLFDLWAGDY